jgi:hypothetical protein
MVCENQWTLQFLDVNGGLDPFEVRPVEISLTNSRSELDFCRATLPIEAGQQMKPETRKDNGVLNGFVKVDAVYDGQTINRLLFRPDWADYGNEFTHIQLHDLQKVLEDGTIDEKYYAIDLKEIYKEIVNGASNKLIDTVKFNLPDNQVRTIYGTQARKKADDFNINEELAKDTKDALANSKFAVDFDKVTPLSAIGTLNQMFRVYTWVNRKGELVVGVPEVNSLTHIAAPNDERVWRYKDPSVNHGREPIQSVLVEGGRVDDEGLENDPLSWFDEGGAADLIALGVAVRTDIDYGTSFYTKSENVRPDSLKSTAVHRLKEKMKNQNTGTVEIDPDLSGDVISNPLDMTPGDSIRLVPEDKYFTNPDAESGEIGDSPPPEEINCGRFVNNEEYLVGEVEHTTSKSGDWQVFADVSLVPEIEVESYMTYYDPKKEELVNQDEIADDGSLKAAIFENS